MTKPRKPRERKPRQPYLPGEDMKPPSIPSLDEAAEKYVAHRDARMAELKDEIAAHDALLTAMQSHGLSEYSYEGNVVLLTNKTKVKVKRKGEKDEDDA